MSIYGPTSEETQQEYEQVDLSVYAKKQYVDNYASYFHNTKVDLAGDTMTGDLSMSNNKLTNVGDPTNDADAANKKYVDNRLGRDHVYVVGRYLVIPEEDGSKNYVSVRPKKNIDLSSDISFELKTSRDDTFDPRDIRSDNLYISSATKRYNLLPGLGNYLGSIIFVDPLLVLYNNHLSKPWTILFSVKPFSKYHFSSITCEQADGTRNFIKMSWESGAFKYIITNDIGARPNIPIELNTSRFNHIAFEYAGNKLTLWANGKSRKMHDVDLGSIFRIDADLGELGILSTYSRDLSKFEIAEHFVEYHVKNFTEDEVLI